MHIHRETTSELLTGDRVGIQTRGEQGWLEVGAVVVGGRVANTALSDDLRRSGLRARTYTIGGRGPGPGSVRSRPGGGGGRRNDRLGFGHARLQLRARAASSFRLSFPVVVLGKLSTYSTMRGYL